MTLRAILLLVLLGCSPALGQLHGRLLTDGYYQLGQYAPLAIRAEQSELLGQRVTLRAAGAIDTAVEIAALDREVVVPWLAVRRVAGPITWQADNGLSGELLPEPRPLETDPIPQLPRDWTLHLDETVPGPAGTMVGETAYLPTFGWSPGVPEIVRRQVIVLAMLFSATFFWLAVWRPRGTTGWMIGASLVMLGVVAGYRAARSPVRQAVGEIQVIRGGQVCVDRWLFETARSEVRHSVGWAEVTHPFFASSDAVDAAQMVLHCDADGSPQRFEYTLLPNRRMAFRSRRIETRERAGPDPTSLSATIDSRLLPLVKQWYWGPGANVTRQVKTPPAPGQVEQWGTVVVGE